MSTQDILSNELAQAEAQVLLTMDESDLNRLLGMRVNAIQKDISLSLQPSFEIEASPFEAATLPPWIQKTVEAMIKTALQQSHNVLCSDDSDYLTLRTQLIGALGLGGTAAVLTFATFLTSTLGLATALAIIVATIVIKKIGEPSLKVGHEAMCAELKKILPT